jgi:UDPglucose 6-dehydrogenase
VKGVTVIGGGYVGLVTAACLAHLGNRVTVVETDHERLRELCRGRCPIHEPGLPELLAEGSASGGLRFTHDCASAVPESELVFVTVNTPARDDGETDTTWVLAAVDAASVYMRPGTTLVIKSTAPPGTADKLAADLPDGVEAVCNPEFLRQGTAVQDFMQPDRIVIGVQDRAAADPLLDAYATLDSPIIITSRRSAELAKYAANAFLAMRISFINEVSELADAVGADVEEVAAVVGSDSRIGPSYLRAGLGWGGSCFPKDVLAQISTARRHGCRPTLLEATHEVNRRQRERALESLLAAARQQRDPTIAIFGLAFKPGTGDLRGSPSLEIIGRLLEAGCHVQAHDPVASAAAARLLPNVRYCETPYEAAAGADAALLATEWDEYRSLDWVQVYGAMRGDRIVDGRNCLDRPALEAIGFQCHAFGRPAGGSRELATPAQAKPGARVLSRRGMT